MLNGRQGIDVMMLGMAGGLDGGDLQAADVDDIAIVN